MLYLFTIWITLAIVLFFYKIEWGMIVYLTYIFLVPYLNISILGFTLQWNLVNTILLVVFFYHATSKRWIISYKPFLPFFLLYSVFFLLSPFQFDTPLSFQLTNLRLVTMTNLIVPFVLFNLIKKKKAYINKIRYVVIGCILISCIYGLLLTFSRGLNPYIMFICEVNGRIYHEGWLTSEESGRLFGRISSVFTHPMTFAIFLALSFIYIYSQEHRINKILWYISLVLIVINMVTCGVRSIVATMFIIILIYLYKKRDFKIFSRVIIGVIIASLIVKNIPELSTYINSIFDTDSQQIRGSSLSMRQGQFQGCMQEFRNNPIIGKGFGWHSYYGLIKGPHPTLFYFESLIYIVLCDSGCAGIILWIIVASMLFSYSKKHMDSNRDFVNILFLCFIVYDILTGDFGMQFFLIFYALLVADFSIEHSKKVWNTAHSSF